MKRPLILALALGSLFVMGCKKQVPTDIIQKSITYHVRNDAKFATIVCGVQAKGLSGAVVTVKSRGENSTGVAHVKGTSLFAQGGNKTCDADLEFAYTFTQKTTGPSRNRRTTTTWYLTHLKLVAVQTPGVTLNGPVDEDVDDDEDDGK